MIGEVFQLVKYKCTCCLGRRRNRKEGNEDDEDGMILGSRMPGPNHTRSGGAGGGSTGSSNSWAATMARAKAQEMEIVTTSMEDLTANGARMERVSPV